MYRSYPVLIAFLSIALCSFSQIEATKDTTNIAHLTEVNQEWKQQPNAFIHGNHCFQNDIDEIQFHLLSVAMELRKRPMQHLTKKQQFHRVALLDTLKQYALNKQFPTNTRHSERTPYFIDDFGVYCAVGYLIKQSGHNELALKVSAEHNYDYIRNIRTKGVNTWADAHGFSIDELAWIQPEYNQFNVPVQHIVDGGMNGAVHKMDMDRSRQRLYVIGEFDSLRRHGACSQFAFVQGTQLSCVKSGLFGELTDVTVANGTIETGTVFITGLIDHEGEKYALAKYHHDSLTFYNVPDRKGFKASTILLGESAFQYEIVIERTRTSEIWRLTNTGTWELRGTVNGRIHSISKNATQIVYGGQFQSFKIGTTRAQIIEANNHIICDLETEKWHTTVGAVADEIFKVKWRGRNFFFAGRDSKGASFTMLHEDSLIAFSSPWLYGDMYANSKEVIIRDFEKLNDSSFSIIGEFYFGFQFDYYHRLQLSIRGFKKQLNRQNGKGQAIYTTMQGFTSFGVNQKPTCVFIDGYQNIFFGGDCIRWQHLSKISLQPGNPIPVRPRSIFDLSPRVESDILTLSDKTIKKVRIYDSEYNLIKKTRGKKIDIKFLEPGLYYVSTENRMGVVMADQFWNP